MKIITKVFMHPNCIIFKCECECENCGHKETLYGHDNEEFYEAVLPKLFVKRAATPAKDLSENVWQMPRELLEPSNVKPIVVVTKLVNSDRDTNLISFNLPAWKNFVATRSGYLSLEHEDVFHLATYAHIGGDVYYVSTIAPDKDLPLAPDLGCPWVWNYETCVFKGQITGRGEFDLDKAQEILTARFLTEPGAREYHQFVSEHLEEVLAKFKCK